MNPVPLWRVFPWDPSAAEGERFSAAFLPTNQGGGRFDLPGNPDGVVYFAESPDHAVAEMIQQFRNATDSLTNADLTRWGHRLALVGATLDAPMWPRIPDLGEPTTLARLSLTAEMPALRDRRRTQRIAHAIHEQGNGGLRWWSSFWGEWHSVILFQDQLSAEGLTYGQPQPLDLTSAAVMDAAAQLDIG
ncbi:MAG TPA: RES family NAD+ phosphorylase [Longimicrobiaceae bacterium]|nr:RES family NAD+ phosphorylase [Longimicrobiaceae bacterium]